MGQQEVYNFLKANKGKKYSTLMLKDILKISRGSLTCCCMKLKKSGFIESERDKKCPNKLWFWIKE